jgi:hypothetical protein
MRRSILGCFLAAGSISGQGRLEIDWRAVIGTLH